MSTLKNDVEAGQHMGRLAMQGELAEFERVAQQWPQLGGVIETCRQQAKAAIKQKAQFIAGQLRSLDAEADRLAAKTGVSRQQGELTTDLVARVERVATS